MPTTPNMAEAMYQSSFESWTMSQLRKILVRIMPYFIAHMPRQMIWTHCSSAVHDHVAKMCRLTLTAIVVSRCSRSSSLSGFVQMPQPHAALRMSWLRYERSRKMR